MHILMLGCASLAHAQGIGSTTIVFDLVGFDATSGDDHTAINLAITTADNEHWFAIEHALWDNAGPDPSDLDDHVSDLLLAWDDGSGIDTKSLSSGRMGAAPTGFPTPRMYPSLVTWPGETDVYVMGAQTVNQTSGFPQVETFRQDRDDLTATPYSNALDNATPDTVHHGRARVAYDYSDHSPNSATEALYFCWTRQQHDTGMDPTPDDDVYEKARPPGTPWVSASHRFFLVESPDGTQIDDHCDIGFNNASGAGYRYGVGHSKGSGAHEIVVDRDSFDGSSWTDEYQYQLARPSGVSGVNFPTISTVAPAWWFSDLVVVAQEFPNNTGSDLVWWRCDSVSGCNAASDWSSTATNLTGTVRAPKVVITADQHVFVAYEDTDSLGFVRLAYMCDGDSDFTSAGALDAPSGGNYDRSKFGADTGDSVQGITWDPTDDTVHVAFLGWDADTDLWNPLHWTGDVSDPCP